MNVALSRLFPSVEDYREIGSAIVIISGSAGSVTMEDYQAAIDTFHEIIPEDTQVLASLVANEGLDENIDVTVMLGGGF